MNNKRAQWYGVFSIALVCVQIVGAQTPTTQPASAGAQVVPATVLLTRPQWLKKIGEAAKDPAAIRTLMAQVSDGEKLEVTQRLLKAITRMPLSPEEKQALLIKASIECIKGTPLKNDERYKTIAEIIAVVPVEFLPGVVGDLSKRFDPKLNNLTDEQFKAMADATIKLAVERNKATDDPAVRNTFAILLFLNATSQPLKDAVLVLLMSRLPDDAGRELAKGYIAEAQKGNYEPLLNAAAVTVRVVPPPVAITRVGVSQLEQLLVDIGGLTGSLADRTRLHGDPTVGAGQGIFARSDVGIQTVPRTTTPGCPCVPYPNQLDIFPSP